MYLEVGLPMASGVMFAGAWIWAIMRNKGFKCVLCGRRGMLDADLSLDMAHPEWGYREDTKAVTFVRQYGCYGNLDTWAEWHYHPTCVHNVLCKPETYGHKKVDIALGILERVEQQREREKAKRQVKLASDLIMKTAVKAGYRKVEDGYLLLD